MITYKFVFPPVFFALTIACAVARAAEPAPPSTGREAQAADSQVPLPPDLPLAASPPNEAEWLREVNMLQPCGHSQFVALANPGDRPARLKQEFGFNAIIVLPPDAHNVVPESNDHSRDHLTEEQFRAGVAAYRAAGYRLVIYTSVMALGVAPEFQSGQISRDHPDWVQRDPEGNPIMVWGAPWLCPNTDAREVALTRALRLAREYQADGIMLDNNQFFHAGAGWTCHCDSCATAFRQYVGQRCGAEGTKNLFGVAPEELQIPREEGPLHALWLHWRNRVWAEINEAFRARLREENPDILFFANTQYAFADAMLGTDFQYEREDVVLSESVSLNSRQMSEKMVLGHALAGGRPLWNYIGTFAKGDDYTGLKPAAVISPLIAATLAHAARPWIVDGFDLGPTDANARQEMSRLLGWHAGTPRLFQGEPWSEVATILSLPSRNVLHQPLIPSHVSALQRVGTPVIAFRDDNLTAEKLRRFRVAIVETAQCLNGGAASLLAEWVRNGGTLMAAPEVGSYDELGRRQPASNLWKALGLSAAPNTAVTVGRGTVIAPPLDQFTQAAVQLTQPHSFAVDPESGVEVVPYRTPNSLLLHVIRHDATSTPMTLRLPAAFDVAQTPISLFVPGSSETQLPPPSPDAARASLELKEVPVYSVIEVVLQ